MKLVKILEITAELELKTGLRIGGGDADMQIGGVDSPIVKHPITLLPYIPGSSIKGKIRSLLEWRSGAIGKQDVDKQGNPAVDKYNKPILLTGPLTAKSLQLTKGNEEYIKRILWLFGVSADNKEPRTGTNYDQSVRLARLSFSDSLMTKEWQDKIEENRWPTTEIKSENSINRMTSVANSPRQIERIPSNTKFDFKVTMRLFDNDNEQDFIDMLFSGFALLELDSLGGYGSRGYGKVIFNDLKINGESQQEKFSKIKSTLFNKA